MKGRRPLSIVGPMLALVLTLPLCASCTEVGVQPLDDNKQQAVDDLMTVQGTVCTSDPEEVVFPVKIMLIVDASGSMQFTDPSDANTTSTVNNGTLTQGVNAYQNCMQSCTNTGKLTNAECQTLCKNANNPGRQAAAMRLVERFKNNPAVSFAVVRFNGRITINGSDVTSGTVGGQFTNNEATLQKAIQGLTQADITTDYQGALAASYQVLKKDMQGTSPVARARTKYVIIFLSDGGPNPVCEEGCGNDKHPTIPDADDWCDLPRDEWCKKYYLSTSMCNDMKNWYPLLSEPCKEYNSQRQIVQKVKEIMALGKQFSVGEIRFHTAFLFVPTLPKAIQDLMAVDKATSEALLKAMAKEGDGVFRNFSAGQQIDFLSFNYSAVSRPFGMTNFIVTNTSVVTDQVKPLADSDGDGLADKTEFAYTKKLSSTSADTDGDGFGDKLEYDRRLAGFDPSDSTKPTTVCAVSSRMDDDGDGLNACEEQVLGTDSKLPDTDRDRIPDGLEFVWGTNPLVPDAKTDTDFDGKFSGDEIRIHASPVIADPTIHARYKYIYDVREQPERPDRRRCYDFTVRRIRLITTEQRAQAGSLGYNEIMLYFDEGPADDPLDFGSFKAACVRAQYVEPSFKSPASGKVTLEAADFVDLSSLVADLAAARTHAGCQKSPPDNTCPDPCKGVSHP